nr:Chain D, B1 globin chain of giant V2 hemoglobin [Lamellibrachia satsuma]3WCT_H Chain H, B1 globin chain of giant V2 hemoglobin [Lamellibrachia satsuma]3WCU_D Chain D, B1 globin chain of giant V2 hemoglobin [Lamellibrachia satsuma]3WCU_H Chain H, B1 globin chain of giant V2 hemoglobin [Lamellibrachia satsuma]3WCV_D Chain D, B1 globin chain of giant V2 hemoglobin [Lamellibrachia satsuma]3WCV_H Chain H, B1 globin chain of giant V2 hemoglobin [Lamellibrachia satsuma]3WCW_D Chain D, B1 globin c
SEFCSEADATIVIKQWNQIYNAGIGAKSRWTMGNEIFSSLFKLKPESEVLFNNVNVANMSSGAFHAHTVRVLSGLDMGINYLNDAGTLTSLTAHLAAQHVARTGLKAVYFDAMGKVLMTVLPSLIDNFNPDAWRNCLLPLKNAIAKGLP